MNKTTFFNHNGNKDIEKVGENIKSIVSNDRFVKLAADNGVEIIKDDQSIQICIFHGTPNNWDVGKFKAGGDLDRDVPVLICTISTRPLGSRIQAIHGNSVTHFEFALPNLRDAGLLNNDSEAMRKNWTELLNALQKSPFTLQEDETIQVSDSLGPFLFLDQSAILAARLITEAGNLCGSAETIECHGVTVHLPPPGLIVKAKALITADENNSSQKIQAIKDFETELGNSASLCK